MFEIRGRPKLNLDSAKIYKISAYIFVLLYIVVLALIIVNLRNYQGGNLSMHPMITSLLALLFVLTGIICIYTMLEIRGRPKLTLDSKMLIKIHRYSGYIFTALYFVILILMIVKLRNYRVGLSPRANIHILLAVVTLPILAIKWAIARIYKKLSAQILSFGVLLFVLGLSLNGITGGYYLKQTTTGISSPHKSLVENKCSKCHTLEKAYSAVKAEDSWKATVEYMRDYDKQWIAESDVPKIVEHLVRIRGVK